MNKGLKYTFFLLIFLILSVGVGIGVADFLLRGSNHKGNGTAIENVAPVENADLQKTAEEKKDDSGASSNVDSNAKFSFAVVGDSQRFGSGDPDGGFQKAIKVIGEKKVDLTIAVGDLVSSCDEDCSKKLTDWKNVLGPLAAKTYEVQGNHDRTGKSASDKAWQDVFALPTNGPEGFSELTYSFDFQNSHFVVLDSDRPKEHEVNKTQLDWLEADLSANKKENTFVFFHEPAYPVSSKIEESLDVKPDDRDALWNILSEYKVTAVFSGHEHIFSRKKIGDIYQFIFGNTDSFNHDLPKAGMADYAYQGESFGIVNVEGNKITVNLYLVDGKSADVFTFGQ